MNDKNVRKKHILAGIFHCGKPVKMLRISRNTMWVVAIVSFPPEWDNKPTLSQCWANVCDIGPALIKRWPATPSYRRHVPGRHEKDGSNLSRNSVPPWCGFSQLMRGTPHWDIATEITALIYGGDWNRPLSLSRDTNTSIFPGSFDNFVCAAFKIQSLYRLADPVKCLIQLRTHVWCNSTFLVLIQT